MSTTEYDTDRYTWAWHQATALRMKEWAAVGHLPCGRGD